MLLLLSVFALFVAAQRLSPADRALITDVAFRSLSRDVGSTKWKPLYVRHKSAVDRRGNLWAFITGQFSNWENLPAVQAEKEWPMDNGFAILLRKQGRGWIKVTSTFGSTDVPWGMWDTEWNAPSSLFR